MNNQTRCGALFDLDGVLVDTEGIYTLFWHEIDRKYPTGVVNFEYVIKGNTLGNILTTYFPDENVRRQIVDELREHERTMRYILFEGVEPFLESLRQAGISSAIVTSSNSRKMEHLFAQLPMLRELVDVVVTEEDVSNSKPDPEGYHKAAGRLGLRPCECVVFEDSMAGVEAGRRAGGAVVAISTTNPAEKLRAFADIVIDNVDKISITQLLSLVDDYR